jgi:hypothetical protein
VSFALLGGLTGNLGRENFRPRIVDIFGGLFPIPDRHLKLPDSFSEADLSLLIPKVIHKYTNVMTLFAIADQWNRKKFR